MISPNLLNFPRLIKFELALALRARNLNAQRNDNSMLITKLYTEPILKLNMFINETVFCSKPLVER